MIKNKVRFFREQKGLSQTELAEIVGLSRNSMSSIERYEYMPSLDTAFKLSNALGIQIVDLFESGNTAPTNFAEPCDFCRNGRNDEDLSDDNDYGSISIDGYRIEDRGIRLMLTYGWGKPLRIETDVWNDKRKEWSLHVLQYYPKFCPECGRRLSEYGAEGDILQNRFPHRKKESK